MKILSINRWHDGLMIWIIKRYTECTGLRLDENRNTDDVQHRHNDKRNTDTDTEKITMLMIFRLDTLKLLMTEQTVCVDQVKQSNT
jgi:hypothetical protein